MKLTDNVIEKFRQAIARGELTGPTEDLILAAFNQIEFLKRKIKDKDAIIERLTNVMTNMAKADPFGEGRPEPVTDYAAYKIAARNAIE